MVDAATGLQADSAWVSAVASEERISWTPELTRSGVYEWQMLATDGYSRSTWTPLQQFRLALPPAAPERVRAFASGTRHAQVYWDRVSGDVSAYTVTSSPGGSTVTVGGTEGAALLSGLANGQTHTFTVTATSSRGLVSASSLPSAPLALAASSPNVPRNVTAEVEPDRESVSVRWDAPSDDGGYPITRYDVSGGSGVQVSTAGDQRVASVSGLEWGQYYHFGVSAWNQTGSSNVGYAPGAVAVFTTPSMPRTVRTVMGDESMDVFWDTPESLGGYSSADTSYTVTASPGGAERTVTEGRTSARIEGLTNGTAYTFTVTATTPAGAGPASTPTGAKRPTPETADSDADGLPDLLEDRAGADPLLVDTDADGLSDAFEVLELIAVSSPSLADTDGDGTLDGAEDSDDDGLADAAEAAAGTGPTNPDTDADTLTDSAEQATLLTDPLLADSDGDGVTDGIEVSADLDPLSGDSDGDGSGDATATAVLPLQSDQVTAAVTGTAANLHAAVLHVTPRPSIPGARSAAVSVAVPGPAEDGSGIASITSSGTGVAVTSVTVPVDADVDVSRLDRLKPFVWDAEADTWKVANNDVSVSTAAHTVTIFTPELGLTYSVVDLDAWRARASACVGAPGGLAPLDVEVIFDETGSVVASDPTGERYNAVQSALSGLRPGDEVGVSSFGVTTISFGWGVSIGPPWFQDAEIPEPNPGSTIERARQQVAAMATRGRDSDYTYDDEPGSNLAGSALPSTSAYITPGLFMGGVDNRYDAPSRFQEITALDPCRLRTVLLVTDGQSGPVPQVYGEDEVPPTPGMGGTQVPVHIFDVGNDGASQSLADFATATGGTYSYVPTATDVIGWIQDITPPPAAQELDPALHGVDSDADGLSDYVESFGVQSGTHYARYRTDPDNPDSDGDGLPDGVEAGEAYTAAELGLGPDHDPITVYRVLSDPSSADGDHDGLRDTDENDGETDPLRPDWDGDGLNDGEEEYWGTGAKQSDTDADGWTDGFEAANFGNDYSTSGGFDPTARNDRIHRTDYIADFALGAFCGDNSVCRRDTVPWLAGNLLSGVLVYGDVRDLVAGLLEGEYVNSSLLLFGMIPGVGDAAVAVAKTTAFLTRAGADPATFGAAVALLRRTTGSSAVVVAALRQQHPGLIRQLTDRRMTDAGIDDLLRHHPDPVRLANMLNNAAPASARRWPDGQPGRVTDGAAGEELTQRLVGGTTTNRRCLHPSGAVPFLNIGCRYIDVTVTVGTEVFAYEAKVGYVSGYRALRQIAKDKALLDNQKLKGVEWHFYVSDTTGRVGPSKSVINALVDAGIPYHIHLPTG